MPNCCAVVGCGSRGNRDTNSFFKLPSIPIKGRSEIIRLKTERRARWISALKRQDLTESKLKYAMICDRHFISGRPAKTTDVNNPDWCPTQQMGYKGKTVTLESVNRWKRAVLRHETKCSASSSERSLVTTSDNSAALIIPEQTENEMIQRTDDQLMINTNDQLPEVILTCCTYVQTDLSMADIENLERANQDVTVEICNLKKKIIQQTISEATFQNDDKRTKYYSGLPTFAVLMTVFELISPYLIETPSSALTKFQQFILTLMHLRLNLPFKDLGYRFNVTHPTVSKYFYHCIYVMHQRLKRFIIWPDREQLKITMPLCFQETFGDRVTVIMDCFEVYVEKPSNVLASAQVWSNYKQKHTIKFLIGICPQGSVSFISCAWGGRTSDKELTLNSGILDKLLPGDLILADRGFLINDAVGLHCAEVKTPSFLKGQKQLGAYELEESRKLSSVRIHVERVIGALRQKYFILSSVLPTHILSEHSPEEVPAVIDQIVIACCALYNICPTVVSFD